METTITKTDLPLKLFAKGKVRDIYDMEDKLLFIATDRISAFDFVLPNGIPYKGKVLNGFSVYWFEQMKDAIQNHVITADVNEYPQKLKKHRELLEGRSMLVKKAKRIDVECVVRGYLAGSAWSEYSKSGTVCGVPIAKGLKQSERLPELIFTPAIKADTGHDENISEKKLEELVGKELSDKLSEASFSIYKKAEKILLAKGIILADTKFEFGELDGQLILIDEILTPDSSRFWEKKEYSVGISPPSLDKQFVRDYLNTTGWDKNSAPPILPDKIVKKTSEKYLEIYKRVTGKALK